MRMLDASLQNVNRLAGFDGGGAGQTAYTATAHCDNIVQMGVSTGKCFVSHNANYNCYDAKIRTGVNNNAIR